MRGLCVCVLSMAAHARPPRPRVRTVVTGGNSATWSSENGPGEAHRLSQSRQVERELEGWARRSLQVLQILPIGKSPND